MKRSSTEAPRGEALSLWQFHVEIMWSRIQTASLIEAGVLGGWYQLWTDGRVGLAKLLLGGGALLLVVVSLLARRDAQYIGACEAGCRPPVPQPEQALIPFPVLDRLRGRRIVVWTILLLAIGNGTLAMLY